LFPLENEFDQISDDQKDEQKQQDNIDIDQAEDDDIVGDGNSLAHLGKPHLEVGKGNDEQRDDHDNVEFISPLLGLPFPIPFRIKVRHAFSPPKWLNALKRV
jgi:hypothetical protein